MTDRELLELAAKAVAFVPPNFNNKSWGKPWVMGVGYWNPLTDDGDALRLAVKLGIQINPGTETNRFSVTHSNQQILEERRQDPYAATRRAIVRAAAEIGKEIK